MTIGMLGRKKCFQARARVCVPPPPMSPFNVAMFVFNRDAEGTINGIGRIHGVTIG